MKSPYNTGCHNEKVLHRFLSIGGFDSVRLLGIFVIDELKLTKSGVLYGKIDRDKERYTIIKPDFI